MVYTGANKSPVFLKSECKSEHIPQVPNFIRQDTIILVHISPKLRRKHTVKNRLEKGLSMLFLYEIYSFF